MINNTFSQPRKQDIAKNKNGCSPNNHSAEELAYQPEGDYDAPLLAERTVLLTLGFINIECALFELERGDHDR